MEPFMERYDSAEYKSPLSIDSDVRENYTTTLTTESPPCITSEPLRLLDEATSFNRLNRISANTDEASSSPARSTVLADIRFNLLGEVDIDSDSCNGGEASDLDSIEKVNGNRQPDRLNSRQVYKIAEIVSLPVDTDQRPLTQQYRSYVNGRPISVRPLNSAGNSRSPYSLRTALYDDRSEDIPTIEYIPDMELTSVDVLNTGHTDRQSGNSIRYSDSAVRRLSNVRHPLIESIIKHQLPAVTDINILSYPTTNESVRREPVYMEDLSDEEDSGDLSVAFVQDLDTSTSRSTDKIVDILSTRDDLRGILEIILSDSTRRDRNGDNIRQVEPISSGVGFAEPDTSISTSMMSGPVKSILRPPRSSHADDVEYDYDPDVIIDIASQRDRYEINESILNILNR